LHRHVRLLLNHRLATLRLRQRRFDECAKISESLARLPLGPAERVRPNLLLMAAAARLEQGALWPAHAALTELYRVRVNLAEALQRLGLRTRYELLAGMDDHAVYRLREKIRLAEIMAPDDCLAMHAMLLAASQRRGDSQEAAWLEARLRVLGLAEAPANVRSAGSLGFLSAPDSPLSAGE
jgi:hypothetical protein